MPVFEVNCYSADAFASYKIEASNEDEAVAVAYGIAAEDTNYMYPNYSEIISLNEIIR